VIEKIPFGSTGHNSSRILFGAAALGGMRQEKADSLLPLLLEHGINHLDVAASYGDAELRLAPWMQDYRSDFFLATKTGDRSYDGAKASIENSLKRMQVDQLDLIQFHNLADEAGWREVMGPTGALKAAVEAKEQGLVRFIGVTGHGTRVAEMHLRSLQEYPFDSVLLPYSHMMMSDSIYAAQFEELYKLCVEKGVAMQTIKAIARRRWRDDDDSRRYSWYEPIREAEQLSRAVHWVLKRPGVFLNSSSDATLLPLVLKAASEYGSADLSGIEDQVAKDCAELDAESLFVRGVMDDVRV